jgi:hypothetical protein
MSDEPLDRRILSEIRARLSESRAAVEESQRLQAALSALGTGSSTTSRAPSRGRRRTATPSKKPRARRGANRDRALQVIADRPGVTVAELAAATGIAKNVLYSLTRTLTKRGAIERVELPADTFGFRIARSDVAGPPNGDGTTADSSSTVRRTRRRENEDADNSRADTTVEPESAETPTPSEPTPA